MKYLVKHTDGKTKLHDSDGTIVKEFSDWSNDWLPDDEQTASKMVADVEAATDGDSWAFRDLSTQGETVPF
ncbi:hypothetical protein M196_gp61 [Halorubrum tailed virus 4]|uniref:Uncharacterized protein n=1 Tax=Halorubrum tailed virus 4 TaxID=1273752 RepID=R4TLW4_9CAUD|nr:hypothetical protein M196_gp61 [Halorubrum tailed virus 4]AGM11153.1 hypothetical protein HRTV4_61 [Halorubrum tailed virus 4]